MDLHKNREEFNQLITLTAKYINIPETAVRLRSNRRVFF